MLEAWDIELIFRRLRQRLSGIAVTLVLAGLMLVPMAQPGWAAESSEAPDSPRLLDQPLTSQASRDSIKAILDQPPFKNPQTVTRYRFGEDPLEQTRDTQTPQWLKALFGIFDSHSFSSLAKLMEILLWACLTGGIAVLIWHYREWLRAFVSRRPLLRDQIPRPAPAQLFGLDISIDTLPADVATCAERLWQTQPREALGLLYRALLSRLLHDFDLPLKAADTEGQVLERIQHLQQPALQAFSQNLTLHWQNLAYGHRLPPLHLQQELCDTWRELFDRGAPR